VRLARDEHSGLLQKSINYDNKKFCITGPRLATNKHSSLYGTFITYEENKVLLILLMTKKSAFITLTPVVNVIKLFSSSLTNRQAFPALSNVYLSEHSLPE
jgi:hypothetical protein